ncbi:RsmB/NOP family class I SAM-dependent RNA methyltransferase [Albibacterium profundi]|uniref:RsmB/NOP family class I SAM-dependent RNA methyltransferase n=1 Tax=Albibacterium profundi TaxID=3134906 RepID=A0ABV5CF59_9SPHI
MNEKRLGQQISIFKNILGQYHHEIPLARFLSSYFRRNKQMGSKDRKIASRLIYNYFRLGAGLPNLPIERRLAIAEFLCTTSSDFVALLEPLLLPHIQKNIEDKMMLLETEYQFKLEQIFPLSHRISPKVNKEKFLQSHFQPRDLFIRLRSGHERFVQEVLVKNNIEYKSIGQKTLQLSNGSQLDKIKEIAGYYEVQDLSSQQIINLLKPNDGESWWDACAASGGKSLLLKEVNPNIELMVSDSRLSILRNLDERFDKAGINSYRKKIIDLTKNTANVIGYETFDGIIVDAPCSGSGTWGRAPEHLSVFDNDKLMYYQQLQRDILNTVVKHVKLGKPLIYITCSVYKLENEDQVAHLVEKGFQVESMDYFEGSTNGADTLFAARLTIPR